MKAHLTNTAVSMHFRAGQIAVITGAGSGLGLTVARACARRGMHLVLCDINLATLNAAQAELADSGVEVLALTADVTKKSEVQRLHDAAYGRFGVVHLMFNNAGAMGPRGNLVTEVTDDELQWILDLNQNSVLHGLRMFCKSMHEGGEEGYVVSTASIYGIAPANGAYGITKQAVVAMTEAFQGSLAKINSKVTAAALCPTFHQSNIAEARYDAHTPLSSGDTGGVQQGRESEEAKDALSAIITYGEPVERVAQAMFDGMEAGQHYIHTNADHSLAFARDRFENIMEHKKMLNEHGGVLLESIMIKAIKAKTSEAMAAEVADSNDKDEALKVTRSNKTSKL